MSLSNQQLLEKINTAIKSVALKPDLSDSVLSAQQMTRFVRQMQLRSTILGEARHITMDSPEYHIDRIGFAGRVITRAIDEGGNIKGTEATADPATGTNKLKAAELRGFTTMNDRALRRSIEKGNLEQTILELFGEAAGRDMEEFALLADTDISNPTAVQFLAATDAWIKLAGNKIYGTHDDETVSEFDGATKTSAIAIGDVTFIVDAKGTLEVGDDIRVGSGKFMEFKTVSAIAESTDDTITVSTPFENPHPIGAEVHDIKALPDFNENLDAYPVNMFDAALSAMPKQYLAVADEWRFYVPWEVRNAYQDYLTKRGTPLGDTATTDRMALRYKGVPVVDVPLITRSESYSDSNNTAGRVAILGHPDNMVWGLFHRITVEPDRDPAERETKFYLTMEGDADYEERDAAVAMFLDWPKSS